VTADTLLFASEIKRFWLFRASARVDRQTVASITPGAASPLRAERFFEKASKS
jgi:hypothetical protein